MFEPPHEADESPSRRTMASDASPLLPQTTTNSTKAPLSLDRMRQLQGHAAEGHSFGALPEAIHCWSSILRELVPHLVGSGVDDIDRAASDGSDVSASEPVILELWIAPVAHAPSSDDAIFALFPYVLVYSAPEPHTHIGTGEHRIASGSDVVRRMGAGVAYNLALAYQMQALQGSNREAHHASLRTALSAYKAARDMLLSARQHDAVLAAQGWKDRAHSASPSSSEHVEDDRLLLLAITNNEGQILEALHERTRVVESLQDLRHGLKGTPSPSGICGHFTVTDALFGDPDVVQFMHPPAA
jgi:hypothetical protein